MTGVSQRIARLYFLVATGLFALQVTVGLWMSAQYLWPKLTWNVFAFNIGREWHLNLLILWLVLGFMGIVYHVLPEETGTEPFSPALAYAQLALLSLTGVAVLVGFLFGQTEGREFLEAPRWADWLIVAGAVMFVVEAAGTVVRRKRPLTATLGVILGGLGGLVAIYPAGMVFFRDLTLDEYFRWWVVHLWVEGAWELIAIGIMGYLLIALTGVPRQRLERWMYVEIGLVVLTAAIGVGHHYYWIGTPRFWLAWGGAFGALEPIPIALMLVDALRWVRGSGGRAAGGAAYTWTVASAWTHFFGAAVWGFAITLPLTNIWTHGTQLTAAHGHLAFFGAYAMLVLAFIYFALTPRDSRASRLGVWAFWLTVAGMVVMALVLTGAGVVQVWQWRVLGMDFITVRDQALRPWMIARFALGFVVLAGVGLFIADALRLWRQARSL